MKYERIFNTRESPQLNGILFCVSQISTYFDFVWGFPQFVLSALTCVIICAQVTQILVRKSLSSKFKSISNLLSEFSQYISAYLFISVKKAAQWIGWAKSCKSLPSNPTILYESIPHPLMEYFWNVLGPDPRKLTSVFLSKWRSDLKMSLDSLLVTSLLH